VIRPLVELFLAHRHSRESWDPKRAAMGKDRRVFQRVSVAVPCRIENRFFGLEAQGVSVNLSLGGMGLMAPVAWPEGSQVCVQFDSLDLEGMIVYRRDAAAPHADCRYGIKFQKLRVRDLWKLRKVLQTNHRGPLAVL